MSSSLFLLSIVSSHHLAAPTMPAKIFRDLQLYFCNDFLFKCFFFLEICYTKCWHVFLYFYFCILPLQQCLQKYSVKYPKSFNEDSRFVFFVWECVCQNAGMFFVIFYFGIYENTCDIGNFEFTHFPSQLQNVNPTANLMKIKHSFSLNPTFFFVFWTLQISTYKAKATKIDICTFHISLSSNWCNLVKEKNIHIFPSPSRLIDGGDGKKTFRDGSWLCLSDSEIWWK